MVSTYWQWIGDHLSQSYRSEQAVKRSFSSSSSIVCFRKLKHVLFHGKRGNVVCHMCVNKVLPTLPSDDGIA
eukprot:6477312-Amphidinium_carterae.1